VHIGRLVGSEDRKSRGRDSYRTAIVLHSSFFLSDSFAFLGEYSGGANGSSPRDQGGTKDDDVNKAGKLPISVTRARLESEREQAATNVSNGESVERVLARFGRTRRYHRGAEASNSAKTGPRTEIEAVGEPAGSIIRGRAVNPRRTVIRLCLGRADRGWRRRVGGDMSRQS
jgi:hypothetical protein